MKKNILQTIFFMCLIINNGVAQSWSALGAGIGSASYHSVLSSTTYNGELVVGGNFTNAGNLQANNIVKWNGTIWLPLGSGLNGTVYSMGVYKGELYVGGSFTNAGNATTNNIARWNGTEWSAVGSVTCNAIQSLETYNDELYAAGYFPNLGGPDGTSIAKWNGTNWSVVGSGVEPVLNSIQCLTVYNGELFVAGAKIGGGGLAIDYSILKWNGSKWSTLITFPASYTPDGALGDILSMTVYNGELYVAGGFTMMIDSVTAFQIAKWNGTNWSAVGTGINFESYPNCCDFGDGSSYSFVKSLAVYNGALYAGGRFSHCGNTVTINIAKWDGINWSGLGLGVYNHVYTLTAYDTSLYVGGKFNTVDGYNTPANKIAKWTTGCINVLSQPGVISGNNIVCQGSSQTYSISPVPGATSYTWKLPSGWTGSSTTTSVNAIAGNNNGNISVIANNSCGSSSPQTLLVSVNSVPAQPGTITGSNMVNPGQTITYSINTVKDATNYLWSLNGGGSIITAQASNSISVNWLTPGNYTLSIKVGNNCGNSTDQTIVISVSVATGLSDPDNTFEIEVLPNPSSGKFYLTGKGAKNKAIKVEVLNIDGRIVYHINNRTVTNEYSQLINIENIARGMYIVKISVGDKVYVRKIVKN